MAKKSNNGQLVAVLSYITWIGWIIALILHINDKTDLGSFHLRQTLALFLAAIVLGWIPIVNLIAWIVLFIFWIMGLFGAINSKKKAIPLLGEPSQQWFKGL